MSELQLTDEQLDDASTDDEIIAQAKQRFTITENAESDFRKQALEDLKFVTGDQWPADVKTQRNNDGRPCLTINKLPQLVRQVTNDQRQNRPSIKVHPVDSNADIDTAEVQQGMIKHIEYNSDADTAYDTACEYQVKCGRGFLRVMTDYVDEMSFDQEMKIAPVNNPFSVYFDPFSKEPDGKDATHAIIVEDYQRAEYKQEFPKSKLASMNDWRALGDGNLNWIKEDSCRIAEYFVKTWKREKILQLSSGDVIKAKFYKEGMDLGLDDKQQPIFVKSERMTLVPTIKWYKINGVEILEKSEWPGQWIPIVPVYGDITVVDGKRIIEGIVRQAKDAQRMYNYMSSNETEVIALAPRAPWVGVVGQFEGHEPKWRDVNRKNYAYLEYNPTDVNGAPAPPPIRNQWEPPVQAITQAKALYADDIKATTGVYDAAIGAQSVESSGVAIQRRNAQVQTSNYHFSDNLHKSIRQIGRILIDLMPVIYDAPRAVRILKDDGTSDLVTINKLFMTPGGEQKMHDMTTGRYDVAVETGPSYATKRMEAAASMESLVKSWPPFMGIAGDLWLKEMDWPGAKALAERVRKTINPALLDDDQNPIPPQAKAQMDQMSQMVQALTGQLNQIRDVLEKKKLEIASREKIEFAKIQAGLEETLLKEGINDAQFLLEKQVEMIDRRQKLAEAQAALQDQSLNPGAGGAPNGAMGNSQQPTGGQSPGYQS